MLWAPVAEPAGVVSLLGAVLLWRPSASKLRELAILKRKLKPSTRKTLASIAVVLLVLVSVTVAPYATNVSGKVVDGGWDPSLDMNFKEDGELVVSETYQDVPEWTHYDAIFEYDYYDGERQSITEDIPNSSVQGRFNASYIGCTNECVNEDMVLYLMDDQRNPIIKVRWEDTHYTNDQGDRLAYHVYDEDGNVVDSYQTDYSSDYWSDDNFQNGRYSL